MEVDETILGPNGSKLCKMLERRLEQYDYVAHGGFLSVQDKCVFSYFYIPETHLKTYLKGVKDTLDDKQKVQLTTIAAMLNNLIEESPDYKLMCCYINDMILNALHRETIHREFDGGVLPLPSNDSTIN
jgi:hypothetical protein